MSDSGTKSLYEGRRLIVVPPDMFGHAMYSMDDAYGPNPAVLGDPLMPAEQALVIESSIPPDELHRLIFGPGDN